MDKNGVEILKGIARLEAGQEIMKEDIASIKREDSRQNELLAEHIAGVKSAHKRIDQEKESWDQLFKMHEENSQQRYIQLEQRLQIVEFLPNLMQGIWKVTKWLGALAAAVTAITKFLGLW